MAMFAWYETNARAIGAEHIGSDEKLPDRDAALALLCNIPAAQAAAVQTQLRLHFKSFEIGDIAYVDDRRLRRPIRGRAVDARAE